MDARWIVCCAGVLLFSRALADSEVHCEVSSSNFAWGPHYAGAVIASDGTVALFEYAFEKHGEELELFGQSWLSPTRAELATRFKPGRRVAGKLCSERRAWLGDRLAMVRTAGLSKEIGTGTHDSGTVRTHCFVLEPGHDRATVVLLQQDGDTERHNLSPAAPQLANWLSAVYAEARRRIVLPAKDSSCIGDLPLTMPLYRGRREEQDRGRRHGRGVPHSRTRTLSGGQAPDLSARPWRVRCPLHWRVRSAAEISVRTWRCAEHCRWRKSI
jgi:hypothetical protein